MSQQHLRLIRGTKGENSEEFLYHNIFCQELGKLNLLPTTEPEGAVGGAAGGNQQENPLLAFLTAQTKTRYDAQLPALRERARVEAIEAEKARKLAEKQRVKEERRLKFLAEQEAKKREEEAAAEDEQRKREAELISSLKAIYPNMDDDDFLTVLMRFRSKNPGVPIDDNAMISIADEIAVFQEKRSECIFPCFAYNFQESFVRFSTI